MPPTTRLSDRQSSSHSRSRLNTPTDNRARAHEQIIDHKSLVQSSLSNMTTTTSMSHLQSTRSPYPSGRALRPPSA